METVASKSSRYCRYLVLGASFLIFPAVHAAGTVTRIEEIDVIGSRSLNNMRVEIQRAQEQVFDLRSP